LGAYIETGKRDDDNLIKRKQVMTEAWEDQLNLAESYDELIGKKHDGQ